MDLKKVCVCNIFQNRKWATLLFKYQCYEFICFFLGCYCCVSIRSFTAYLFFRSVLYAFAENDPIAEPAQSMENKRIVCAQAIERPESGLQLRRNILFPYYCVNYVLMVILNQAANFRALFYIKLALFTIYMTHLVGCLWFFLGEQLASRGVSWIVVDLLVDADLTRQYLRSVYYAISTLSTVCVLLKLFNIISKAS